MLQPLLALFGAVNMEDLMNSFRIMGQGMLGIFVVLVLIALIVALLAKVTNRKTKEESRE